MAILTYNLYFTWLQVGEKLSGTQDRSVSNNGVLNRCLIEALTNDQDLEGAIQMEHDDGGLHTDITVDTINSKADTFVEIGADTDLLIFMDADGDTPNTNKVVRFQSGSAKTIMEVVDSSDTSGLVKLQKLVNLTANPLLIENTGVSSIRLSINSSEKLRVDSTGISLNDLDTITGTYINLLAGGFESTSAIEFIPSGEANTLIFESPNANEFDIICDVDDLVIYSDNIINHFDIPGTGEFTVKDSVYEYLHIPASPGSNWTLQSKMGFDFILDLDVSASSDALTVYNRTTSYPIFRVIQNSSTEGEVQFDRFESINFSYIEMNSSLVLVGGSRFVSTDGGSLTLKSVNNSTIIKSDEANGLSSRDPIYFYVGPTEAMRVGYNNEVEVIINGNLEVTGDLDVTGTIIGAVEVSGGSNDNDFEIGINNDESVPDGSSFRVYTQGDLNKVLFDVNEDGRSTHVTPPMTRGGGQDYYRLEPKRFWDGTPETGWNSSLTQRYVASSSLAISPCVVALSPSDDTLRLYCFFVDAAAPDDVIRVSYSDNFGISWSAPTSFYAPPGVGNVSIRNLKVASEFPLSVGGDKIQAEFPRTFSGLKKAILVFEQSDTGGTGFFEIWSINTSNGGSTWSTGTPVLIDSDASADVTYPDIKRSFSFAPGSSPNDDQTFIVSYTKYDAGVRRSHTKKTTSNGASWISQGVAYTGTTGGDYPTHLAWNPYCMILIVPRPNPSQNAILISDDGDTWGLDSSYNLTVPPQYKVYSTVETLPNLDIVYMSTYTDAIEPYFSRVRYVIASPKDFNFGFPAGDEGGVASYSLIEHTFRIQDSASAGVLDGGIHLAPIWNGYMLSYIYQQGGSDFVKTVKIDAVKTGIFGREFQNDNNLPLY